MMEIYRKQKPSILKEKSMKFSARIIKMSQYLQRSHSPMPVNNQLLRSGTSIYANINEAEFAQSQADFVHKLSIALKEANETKGWIQLVYSSDFIDKKSYESILSDCSEIIAMLVASINTTKKRYNL